MGYRLTTDKGGFLRIKDEDSSVTFRCKKDSAQLLSIMVSDEYRGTGMGRDIISVAEAELFNRGISVIKADFMEDIEGMPEFLNKCGYELKDSIPVVSVDTELLLGATAVKKARKCSFDDGFYLPATDLLSVQWNELMQLFNKLSIPIVKSEVEYFSEELSGVVYNGAQMPKAFIFCSDIDDSLYVDFLGGVSKKEPQYVMIALQGMLRSFENGLKTRRYKRIAMLLSDNMVYQLLKRVLDRGTKISEISRTFHAEKRLSVSCMEQYEEIPEVLLTENIINSLIDDYSDFPMQKNVCWKSVYSLSRRGAS